MLMMDSMTAEGWMKKSNFVKSNNNPIQAMTCINAARHYAKLFMDTDVKGYSQWFVRKSNNIADALLLDWHRRDNKLTFILRSHFPKQMPEHFKISPLPSKISLWLTSILQGLPVNALLQENHKTTGLKLGGLGRNTVNLLDVTTFTWTNSPDKKEFSCWELLPWLSEKEDFLQERHEHLAGGTVQGTISHVVQAFRAKGRPNPTKDANSKLSILLSRQFRAYRNVNPKQVQKKALPFAVFDKIAKRQVIELDRAIVQLTIGAAFFACHSCKILEGSVEGHETHKASMLKEYLELGLHLSHVVLTRLRFS